MATLATGTFAKTEVVIDQCYDSIEEVSIQATGTDAWAGSLEASFDGGATYGHVWCTGCTGSMATGYLLATTEYLVVDGDSNGADEGLTQCLDGAACAIDVFGKV
jgi:hypothetical protein